MKIEKTDPKFTPVKIVLESKEEFDAMFAIMNFTVVAQALSLPRNTWEEMNKIRVGMGEEAARGYHKYHTILNSLLVQK